MATPSKKTLTKNLIFIVFIIAFLFIIGIILHTQKTNGATTVCSPNNGTPAATEQKVRFSQIISCGKRKNNIYSDTQTEMYPMPPKKQNLLVITVL